MKTEHNPGRYATLLTPLSRDAANENMQAFFEEVGKLRERYHIPDVLVVVKTNVEYEGAIGEAIASNHYGSTFEAEALAAYALGQLREQTREHINKLVAGKGVRK
jgi:hypothetical protein